MKSTDVGETNLDETDLRLLEFIDADFDVNLEVLSDELGISKSAVHYRLNKLQDKGIVKGISADIDSLALGLEMAVITDVIIDHNGGNKTSVGENLRTLSGVQQVYHVMGDVDFVVISRCQHRDQMNDLLDKIVSIDGVKETSSRFVMDELETNTNLLANMSQKMKQNILDQN
ncbi:MAG: Lrp/AsnC family transcriptional regulator [Halobacteriaceae archaeon]